ncbi:DUF5110 domain-containing protein [Rubrobacter marinus]|uniref:DUF5110 domain-containing protein n=1 Tax=Rubrobacter marinus TaxID=2653852 RepID=UPI001A9FA1F4|nr:DUF5110 domain-containing protein [Rubrobacter marinus]
MNHVGERAADPLTLLVRPAAGAAGGETSLYEDAGDGFAHESGEYARRSISCEAPGGETTVRLAAREGSFVPSANTWSWSCGGWRPVQPASPETARRPTGASTSPPAP